jgi:hypothetical protein
MAVAECAGWPAIDTLGHMRMHGPDPRTDLNTGRPESRIEEPRS